MKERRLLLEGAREEAREQGLKEGREQGIKEGIKEGVKEGVKNTAKNLLILGMDKETVAKATNLDMEEIEEIQGEISH